MNGELFLIDIEFQFYQMKRVLEIDGGDHSTLLGMYLIPLNCVKLYLILQLYLKMAKMTSVLCIFYCNKKIGRKTLFQVTTRKNRLWNGYKILGNYS